MLRDTTWLREQLRIALAFVPLVAGGCSDATAQPTPRNRRRWAVVPTGTSACRRPRPSRSRRTPRPSSAARSISRIITRTAATGCRGSPAPTSTRTRPRRKEVLCPSRSISSRRARGELAGARGRSTSVGERGVFLASEAAVAWACAELQRRGAIAFVDGRRQRLEMFLAFVRVEACRRRLVSGGRGDAT
jgi:hypothetical protein